MKILELRNPDAARCYLLEGLCLTRALPLSDESIASGLTWALEMVSDGALLPPLGFVTDVGEIARGVLRSDEAAPELAGFDHRLMRRYEDYVLGKLYADANFERGGDAILRYKDRDRDRAVAYLLNQIGQRCGIGGAVLSPAVVKGMLQTPPHELLAEARALLDANGWSDTMLVAYDGIVSAVHHSAEIVGPEVVFELEHGMALTEFGQRVALRQVLRAASLLEANLPAQKPRPGPRRYSVATNFLEEDAYPIGGFSSITNRGTVESLLRSELAYMDDGDRPDLFDIKFARDELLYYSRDENQFQRRHLSFIFALYPNLSAARVKDAGVPWQRNILLLASLLVAVRKLTEWLSGDAIKFEFLFVAKPGDEELIDERALLETLFREEIDHGQVLIQSVTEAQLFDRVQEIARRSLCHVLLIAAGLMAEREVGARRPAIISQFAVNRPSPVLQLDGQPGSSAEAADETGWRNALECLFKFWI